MLFAVTILFILFVCIRMSVTTHYFKYYVGEQESPLLSQVFNFLLAYIVKHTSEESQILLDAYMLEKSLYEVHYELNHRPDWVHIPLLGILSLLQANEPAEGKRS